jgi:uncharacterized OB-fold protein
MRAERDYSNLLNVQVNATMPYEWSIGRHGSRFFQQIKEKQSFVGTRCPECEQVYIPPRRVCGPCFLELDELVELPTTGTITAFTILDYPFIDPSTGEPREVPYTYGYIRIDGADCIFSHMIDETDPNKIAVGDRVRAVFKPREEMQGNIQDILHFEIVD